MQKMWLGVVPRDLGQLDYAEIATELRSRPAGMSAGPDLFADLGPASRRGPVTGRG